MVGLLDLFGGGGGDASLYGGMLTPEQQQAVRNQGLLSSAAALSAAGAPSRLPVPLGAAMGQATLAGMNTQNAAGQEAIKNILIASQAGKDQLGTLIQVAQFNRGQRARGLPEIPLPGLTGSNSIGGIPSGYITPPPSGATGAGGVMPGVTGSPYSISPQVASGIREAAPSVAPYAGQETSSSPADTAGADSGMTNGGASPTASPSPGLPTTALAPNGSSYTAAPVPSGAPAGMPGYGGYATTGIPGLNVSPSTVQGALFAEDLFPGAGKEILGKIAGPTDMQRALQAANIDPNSPQGKQLLALAAARASGIDVSPNLRQGGSAWQYDPARGGYVLAAQNPILGQGQFLAPGPNGGYTANLVPNFIPNMAAVKDAENRTAAAYRPLTGITDQGGNPVVGNQAMLGRGTMPASPVAAPASTSPAPSAAAPRAPVATAPVAAPAAAAPPPAAPGQIIKTPEGPQDISKITLKDVIPDTRMVPGKPAPPPGMFYGAPGPGAAKTQELDSERLAKYQNQTAEGQKIYLGAEQLLDVLKRGQNTNKLAPLWTDLTNVAQGLGLGDLIPQQYDPNDAAVFDKVATDMVFSALKQIPGQPRVAEIEGLRQANPNRTLPRAANIELLQSIIANQQWVDKRAELASEFHASNPAGSLGYFDSQFNKKFPLIDVYQNVAKRARSEGWRLPGDQGAGAAPSYTPPAIPGQPAPLTLPQARLPSLPPGVSLDDVRAELARRGAQ